MEKKIKAYVSQLTMHFGSATVTGSLVPVRAVATRPEYKLISPDGKPVEQVYRDEDGKIWEKDVLQRYEKNDPERKIVPDEAVQQAKESSLPKNIMNLTAHPRSDVERYIFPSTNQAYIFRPVIKNTKGKEIKDPVNVQWYDFINTILRDSDLGLLGLCNLQNHEGLFRLGLYQGWVTVQKQLYPEELNQFDVYKPSLGEAVREKALAVSQKTAVDFQRDEYVNMVTQRLLALKPDSEGVVNALPVAPVAQEIDMLAALESFGV